MAIAKTIVDADFKEFQWIVISGSEGNYWTYDKGKEIRSSQNFHVYFPVSGSGFPPELVLGPDREPVLGHEKLGLPKTFIGKLEIPAPSIGIPTMVSMGSKFFEFVLRA